MKSPARIAAVVVLLTAILAVPSTVLTPLGAASAGGMIGLGGLGIAFIAVAANRRVALIASAALGLAALATVDGAALPVLGVAAMVLVAIGQGITARWGWHRAFMVLPIALSFITAESILAAPLDSPITFALAITGYGVVVAFGVSVLARRLLPARNAAPTPDIPWGHALGYAGMLAVATGITTPLVLLNDWGHAGGWLMMTPFIVIQPYVGDGMPKAINRALGTIGGFAVAYVAADVLGQGPALTVIGYVFAVLTVIAMVKHWHYALYAMVLTPAVVILESIGRSVQETSDHRLVATLAGVGLSLVVMAIAVAFAELRARPASTASADT